MGERRAGSDGQEADLPDPRIERRFECQGEGWIATAIGWSRTGRAPDRGSRLVLVTFARPEKPGEYVREYMGAGDYLADLSEDDLEAMFARAKPCGESQR
jgi:hypothetical protein